MINGWVGGGMGGWIKGLMKDGSIGGWMNEGMGG